MAATAFGVAQPADPGPHRITLRRGDEELTSEEVAVESGQLSTVALEAPPAPPTPEQTARASLRQPDSSPLSTGGAPPAGIEEQWWFWTLIGAGAAAVVVAIVAAVLLQPAPLQPGDNGAVHTLLLEAR